MPLEPIGNDSQHPIHTNYVIREKKQFISDQIALCKLAQERCRLECDLYGMWDPLWSLLALKIKNVNAGKPTVTVGVMSQYRIEKNHGNVRRYKVPDTVVLGLDDTPQKVLLFWAEIKPLDYYDWFTPEAHDAARVQIVNTVNQVNTQPIHLNGPYTRSQVPMSVAEDAGMEIDVGVEVPAEEEEAEDVVTTPGFPYGTEPRCLFKMRRLGDDDRDDDSEGDELGEDNDDLDDLNEDEGDEEEEAKSEGGMFNGEFSLDLPLRRYHINPILLMALRRIMGNNHDAFRRRMQNVSWFDCNYGN
ncbi:hypothetical protein EV359DRAFT_68141 [Lentinula novae-zelandiae]|nr:hypothetical protein EV359DRAFT_68141 [Lentinula novae-zelandiae]